MSMILSFVIYFGGIAGSCVCVAFASRWKRYVKSLPFFLLAVLIPALIATFRESGVDTETYRQIFVDVHIKGNYGYSIEKGWLILNIIAPSFRWLLFFSSVIFLGFAYRSITILLDRYEWLTWFSFLILCYFTFLNGMRQMIAASITFWGVACFLKKRNFRFFLSVVLAVLFHRTALVMILIPFVFWLQKHEKAYYIILAVFTFGMLIFSSYITAAARALLGQSKYFEVTPNLSFGFLLYMIPPLIPYLIQKGYYDRQSPYAKKMFMLYLLSFSMQFVGFLYPFFDRFAWYFEYAILILIAEVVKYSKNKSAMAATYLAWYAFHHFVTGMVMNGNKIYPYR